MAWVVDTCILIDVALADPEFGLSSARFLTQCLGDGLVVCPLTYVELAPTFRGRRQVQEEFLLAVGADFHEPWTQPDTAEAFEAWNRYVQQRRRQTMIPKRPLADVLIGAFACRFDGLITRNPEHFTPHFPSLNVLVPPVSSA